MSKGMNRTGKPKFAATTSELQRLGRNIRNCRIKAKMTQQALSQHVGYDWPKQIYEIERGGSTPSVIMLARICKALDVSFDQIIKDVV